MRVIKLGEEQSTITLATYPNPVADGVKVTLPNSWQNKAVGLELYTINGIRVQNLQINNARQTETLQLGKAAAGIYIVKASCGGQIAQQRIIKN